MSGAIFISDDLVKMRYKSFAVCIEFSVIKRFMFIYCNVWLTYGFQHLISECLKKLAKIDNKEKALLVKVLSG